MISGGRSSEHDVSLRSGAAVAGGLREGGHEVVEVVIAREGGWRTGGNPVRVEPGAGLLDCEVAFPVLHGPFGEDGTVQGLLEGLDLPYVGPGVLAAAVTIDKLTCKRLLVERGIAQVDFCSPADPGWRERAEAMGLPLWVKPSRLGSSVGISRVDSLDRLDVAIAEAERHDPRVIVEAHAEGREIECSVLGNLDPIVSPPGEIVTSEGWYDFESKYQEGGMRLEVPAPIGKADAAEIRRLAREVFLTCDCTGLARCDFFLTADSRVLVNEINTIPGFTETSVYAKLLEADGIGYIELCDRLLELAVERYQRGRSYSF